jgi:pimeloyl-ACP methyl ester carboxylesterase
VPLEAGRALHDSLPGAKEFVVVPGAAHTPALSHPDVVTPAIVEFLG